MIYTVTLNPALDRQYTVRDFTQNTVLRAQDSRVDIGGKGFNVSRALSQLGVSSTAMGFTGGKTGEMAGRVEALGHRARHALVDLGPVLECGDHALAVGARSDDLGTGEMVGAKSIFGKRIRFSERAKGTDPGESREAFAAPDILLLRVDRHHGFAAANTEDGVVDVTGYQFCELLA